jgi:hypothetical protein
MDPHVFKDTGSPAQDRQALKCERYLQTMNAIVQEYDQTVRSTLFGPQGINLDEKSMRAAAKRTLKLGRQLKGVHPPQEIALQHKELAASLPTLHDFFELSKPGTETLSKGLVLADQIRRTLDVYHQGVLAMIANHGLDLSLDPVAAEEQAVTKRTIEGVEQWTNQATGLVGAVRDSVQNLMQQQYAAPIEQYRAPGGQYMPLPEQNRVPGQYLAPSEQNRGLGGQTE